MANNANNQKEQILTKEKLDELKKMWKIDETFKAGAYFISKPESLLNLKPRLLKK